MCHEICIFTMFAIVFYACIYCTDHLPFFISFIIFLGPVYGLVKCYTRDDS